jgi:3-isopropylmalate dehydratase small subunit
MIKEEFDSLIENIVKKDIEVTVKLWNKDVVYDLNTEMKSHLYLRYDAVDKQCIYYGRYDDTGLISDYNNLLRQVKKCLHGRDFGNQAWIDLLVDERVLEVEVTTTRTFK